MAGAPGGARDRGADGAQRAVGAAPAAGAGLPLPAARRPRQRLGGGGADVQRVLGLGRRQDRAAGRQPVVAARANCSTRPSTASTWWPSRWRWRSRGMVPWWVVVTLIGRDVVLAATLPVLRSRGLTALPVTYIGKAATFALMSGFPLILLGQLDALWSRVILACGWAFLIWGLALYLWSAVLYLIQVGMVVRQMPKAPAVSMIPDEGARRLRPEPAAIAPGGRADADSGAVAAAVAAVRPSRPRLCGGRRRARRRRTPPAGWPRELAGAGRACDRDRVRRSPSAQAQSAAPGVGKPSRCWRAASGRPRTPPTRAAARRDALASRGGHRAAQPARGRRAGPGSCSAASTARTSRPPPPR